MNAKRAKAIRKFMRDNMGLDPQKYKEIYKKVKRAGTEHALPKQNWKVGEVLKYRFQDGKEKIMRVLSINGYSTITGELHLTLVDPETQVSINSAFDKDRFKI